MPKKRLFYFKYEHIMNFLCIYPEFTSLFVINHSFQTIKIEKKYIWTSVKSVKQNDIIILVAQHNKI